MSLWMRQDVEEKAAPSGAYGSGWGGGPIWSDAFRSRRAPTPYELVDAYKSLVYACVNLNANAVARTPLRLYAMTKQGQARPKCASRAVSRAASARLKSLSYIGKAMAQAEEVEEVTEHPLLDALMNVNEEVDHAQLLKYVVMSMDVVGSAYIWPTEFMLGAPRELWPLPPHLVYPVGSSSLYPPAYMFGANRYEKDELIRIKHPSMRNLYGVGYSPTQAAIEYARLEDTFVSIQDDMLSNGPRPSLIVSHKDPKGAFGDAERKRLTMELNQKARGGNAGKVIIVDGAAAVTPASYSPTDLATKELSLYDMQRIANCFDVPVSMLTTDDVNRANAEAGLEQHGRNAVEPRCKAIASTLTRWTHRLDAKGRLGWDRLFWAFDPVVAEDKAAEADLQSKQFSMAGITPNEIRVANGLEPVEGGDTVFVPSSLVPLEQAIKPPEEPEAMGNEEYDDEGSEDEEPPLDDEEQDTPADKALRRRVKSIMARLGDVRA